MSYPLEGIRVVDLTVVWSGPGATALLGDLGAEVIRLEGNNRASRQVSAKTTKELIAATGYHGGTYPDKDPGERPYERTALFNWHSRNKLAACANLETEEGHAAAIELIKISDVLVENNSNGTLEKLGLGHETLLSLNPRLVVVRMPPMGMAGPMSDYLGYGPNFNSLVGIAAMDGYEGEDPDSAGENYHMDEAAPAGVAFAVMAALWDRERTGLGGLIEFPQAEAVMADIGEFVLDCQMNARNPQVLGNTDLHMLQDVFLSADEDRWLAVSVRDDRDWAATAALVDAEGLAGMGETAALRAENSAAIRAVLAGWCRTRSAEQAVHELQDVGVPAGEVMSETRLLEDPHLAARDWFQERSHPSIGTHRYPGHPWRAEGFDLAFGRPVPSFGEDNEYLYQELLGYSAEQYADQVARGLITDHQIA
ncbi:CaiB/BaiF CoA transferase family protein [Rhodococcus qingshengii]|uniref:CaiB/BaiF CoA transferase family protein n=1 Tax=Rhodococcus qingshengii TaxID=334542 RepID=UPI0030CD76AB